MRSAMRWLGLGLLGMTLGGTAALGAASVPPWYDVGAREAGGGRGCWRGGRREGCGRFHRH